MLNQAGAPSDIKTSDPARRSGWLETAIREPNAPLILRFFMVHNMAMRIGDRVTAHLGLTSSRWMLLCALADQIEQTGEAPTVSQLSEDVNQSVQNVSRMLQTLEEEGLVEVRDRIGWGRRRFVALTDAGEAVVERLHGLGDVFHEHFLAGLDANRIDALAGEIDRLIENLDRYEQELANAPASEESAS